MVTTSTTRLVNPHAYGPAEWRDQLAAAAKEGQVSLYASGIEPGFAADYLPLVLSTQSSQIEKIHAYEIGLYDDYGVPDIMSDALGFGRPLDYYTGLVFEVLADGFAAPLVGGGRYDRMMEMLGAPDRVPAVGFTLRLDLVEVSA